MTFDWNEGHLSTYEELNRYYSLADCLVNPTRAEGFGLTPYEALLCGLKVVNTSDGETFKGARFPHKEYLDGYIYPISYKITPKVWQHSVWQIDGIWAEPDLESLKEQLKSSYLTERKAARDYISNNFSLQKIGYLWKDFLTSII